MTYTNKLSFDGEVYRFNGLISELKQFVDKSLELKWNWTSPGGDIKLFNTANSEFNIKWYGHSKKLIILADNEQYLKRKLSCLVNIFECDEATNVRNSSSVSKAKVCEHTDNCINRDIIAQLEGVKLDLKTLESRLFTSIS